MIYVWMKQLPNGAFEVFDSAGEVYLRTFDAKMALGALKRKAKRRGYSQGMVLADPKVLDKQANL